MRFDLRAYCIGIAVGVTISAVCVAAFNVARALA